jgi:large subunit ribosomal protein L24
MKFHVKKGDTVEVIAGNDRGSSGKVVEICADGQRVRVEGVRLVKRHSRKSPSNPQGGIVEKVGAIHISNVKLLEPAGANK